MNDYRAINYISKKVKEARGGLSYREFAKKCGLSHAYLQRIETGLFGSKPPSITLSTLCKLVHAGIITNPEQLIGVIFHDAPRKQ